MVNLESFTYHWTVICHEEQQLLTRKCKIWLIKIQNLFRFFPDEKVVFLHISFHSQQAGEKAVFLHGCVSQGCTKVWGPEDEEDVCNLCQSRRYDGKGKPREFVIHFPLKNRFEKLLTCEQYRQSVRWECERRKTNDDYITGRY